MTLRCVECKRKKRDVRPRVDPWKLEIQGKRVRRNLCKACERAIGEEV